ncbi:peptide deformylase [Nostoc sp. 3335mG]|nr:peptide deformylase [Nostoc sp. 3335mG]
MDCPETPAVNEKFPPFILFPDARLNTAATARSVDDALVSIGRRLLAAAESVSAYGLAGAHIGEVAPVAVVSLGDPTQRDYMLLFNPRVTATGTVTEMGPEGSVSMPGIEVEVNRPIEATIAFEGEEGGSHELQLSGFAARVAQHEIDQVNGVFFLTRVSRLKREAAMRRFAKLGKR